MVAVVLFFSWGALLVRGDSELSAQISHDECVDFRGSAEALNGLGQILIAQKYVDLSEWRRTGE